MYTSRFSAPDSWLEDTVTAEAVVTVQKIKKNDVLLGICVLFGSLMRLLLICY